MLLFPRTIKAIVVDDSPFMRKIISDILNSQEDIQVIATAKNGKEAIDIIKSLEPDVVTMDIEMPIMDGLKALDILMNQKPVPIVMLSSLTSEGAEATLTALELGAVDFIQKPSSIFMTNAEDLKNDIIEKVRAAYGAKLVKINKTLPKTNTIETLQHKTNLATKNSSNTIKNIIAIGISTGGPRALQHIIPMIPKGCPASFLVVQHMPAGFTKSLAQRLNNMAEVVVKEAEHNEKLQHGHVYIAAGNYHMELRENDLNSISLNLSQGPTVSGHRPSADVLFSSLSHLKRKDINIVGVIMTGMGSDGTKGLIDLKSSKKSHIIAQDNESSVVFGMPKSAIKAGIVDEIVPLEKIIANLLKRVEVL